MNKKETIVPTATTNHSKSSRATSPKKKQKEIYSEDEVKKHQTHNDLHTDCRICTKEIKEIKSLFWMYSNGSSGQKKYATLKLEHTYGYDKDHQNGYDDGEPPVNWDNL